MMAGLCRPKAISGDRYIPSRSGTDFNKGYHALISSSKDSFILPEPRCLPVVPVEKDTLRCALLDEAFGILPEDKRILSFNPETSQQYFRRSAHSRLRKRRKLTWTIDGVYDLPGFENDFFTNALDWSIKNVIVVAIGNLLAMLNATTLEVTLAKLNFISPSVVTSLAVNPSGEQLLYASSQGQISLVDLEQHEQQRSIVHKSWEGIGVVRWCDNIFFSGNSEGNVFMHDPRVPERYLAKFHHSKHRITALQPSPDNRLLACGAEKGEVVIWDIGERKIFQKIDGHKSGNKALAWVPWRRRWLTTGGGVEDGYLKLWNVYDNHLLFEHNTETQITSAIWSEPHMALLTAHGVEANRGNDILIWRWCSSDPVVEYASSMTGHKSRPLHLALSPDGNRIASASADETLRLWKLSSSKIFQSCINRRSQLDLCSTVR